MTWQSRIYRFSWQSRIYRFSWQSRIYRFSWQSRIADFPGSPEFTDFPDSPEFKDFPPQTVPSLQIFLTHWGSSVTRFLQICFIDYQLKEAMPTPGTSKEWRFDLRAGGHASPPLVVANSFDWMRLYLRIGGSCPPLVVAKGFDWMRLYLRIGGSCPPLVVAKGFDGMRLLLCRGGDGSLFGCELAFNRWCWRRYFGWRRGWRFGEGPLVGLGCVQHGALEM